MKITTKKGLVADFNFEKKVTVPAKDIDNVFYAHGQKTQKVSKSFNFDPSCVKVKGKDIDRGCVL